jgi:hypothetical protein
MTRAINKVMPRKASSASTQYMPQFRPYVPPKFEPPRQGSMRHAELPSVAGGVRYYPRRPWASET